MVVSPKIRPPLPPEKPSPRKSKTLLLRLFLWIKRFLGDRKLPYVANQACRVYFGKEKSSRRKCQSILQTRLELDTQQLTHFFQTAIGDRLLSWLSPLFHFPGQANAKAGLQQLFLEMAGSAEGISLLQLLHLVPERTQIDVDRLMSTADRIEGLVQRTNHLIDGVQAIAQGRIQPELMNSFTDKTDLRKPGSYGVTVTTLPKLGDTLVYLPEPLSENTSVIVQSHGLGAMPDDLADFSLHLASHGYFVVAPHHKGSNSDRLKLMLQGDVSEVFPFSEFGDRPTTISTLLDQLESINLSEFAGKLNLQAVGVMGHSFGSYTALALGGAEIQFDHLELACDGQEQDPNLSLLLQCQALSLPRTLYHLGDPRVRCICVLDFVGSEIFGAQGLATVQIPVLAIAGSHDITTPFALEQLRLFQWLQTEHRYLALMEGKPHVQNFSKLAQAVGLKIAISPQRETNPSAAVFSQNIQALSLAFFATHLREQQEYQTYLTANYGQFLGRSPHQIALLDSEDSQKLQLQRHLANMS